MTQAKLGMRTYGAIRGLLRSRFTRELIQQLLLEAGSPTAVGIPFTSNMSSPEYRGKADMISVGLDQPFQKMEAEAANALVLELVRLMAREAPDTILSAEVGLEEALRQEGIELSSVLSHGRGEVSKRLSELVQERELTDIGDLQRKAWSRIETDPAGAITAASSAVESICRDIIERLSLEMPGKPQLPDLLVAIRKQTNFDALFPFGDKSKALTSSIAGVASNAYNLAHDAGDRHGNDPGDPAADSNLAHIFVSCCDLLSNFLLQMVRLGRLVKTTT